MPFIESFKEFRDRQGCEYVAWRGVYLFANGARSDGDCHEDPSRPDSPESIAMRLQFVKAKRALKIEEYNRDRKAVADQAHYYELGAGPLPPANWEAHLRALIEEIEHLKEIALDLEAQLPLSPQQQAARHRENRRAQERATARGVLNVLQQLPNF